MTIPTIQFEAKKHAYRQTQDGVVVSFVVHPNELHAGFAVAPLGTRYMVVAVEITDDEQPLPPGALNGTAVRSSADADHPPPPPRSAAPQAGANGGWYGLKPSARAALLCKDEGFRVWINRTFTLGVPVETEEEVAGWLRNEIGARRRDLDAAAHSDREHPAKVSNALLRFATIERAYRVSRGLETEAR